MRVHAFGFKLRLLLVLLMTSHFNLLLLAVARALNLEVPTNQDVVMCLAAYDMI